jgi:hypothetical protein
MLCNVPGELVRLMGDWRSTAYLRYIEFDNASRKAITSSLAAAVRALGF